MSSLLRRSVQQDPMAWERLVSLYGPVVYCWCRKWGLQPCDAENIGQETFLNVARKLQDFDPNRPGASFRSWLFRIARNRLTDYLRTRGPGAIGVGGQAADLAFENIADERSIADSDEPVPSDETALLYRQALELIREEVTPRDWELFYQVAVQGRTPRDVADEMDVTTNVVYLAKSRILRRLKEEFAGLLPVIQ